MKRIIPAALLLLAALTGCTGGLGTQPVVEDASVVVDGQDAAAEAIAKAQAREEAENAAFEQQTYYKKKFPDSEAFLTLGVSEEGAIAMKSTDADLTAQMAANRADDVRQYFLPDSEEVVWQVFYQAGDVYDSLSTNNGRPMWVCDCQADDFYVAMELDSVTGDVRSLTAMRYGEEGPTAVAEEFWTAQEEEQDVSELFVTIGAANEWVASGKAMEAAEDALTFAGLEVSDWETRFDEPLPTTAEDLRNYVDRMGVFDCITYAAILTDGTAVRVNLNPITQRVESFYSHSNWQDTVLVQPSEMESRAPAS